MKKFSTLLLLLIFVPLHAHEGGQGGSGSAGCFSSANIDHWRTFKRIKNSTLFNPLVVSDTYSSRSSRDTMPIRGPEVILTQNIQNLSVIKRARKSFARISNTSPHFYATIKELFTFFDKIYLIQKNIDGNFNEHSDSAPRICRLSPAIVTLPNGAVVISRKIWNELDNELNELVIIHEVLKFAQIFHPAFKTLSNEELQDIATLFITNSNRSKIALRLRRFEKTLAQSNHFYDGLPTVRATVSEETVSSAMLECQDAEKSLSTCLKETRENPFLDKLIRQDIQVLFLE